MPQIPTLPEGRVSTQSVRFRLLWIDVVIKLPSRHDPADACVSPNASNTAALTHGIQRNAVFDPWRADHFVFVLSLDHLITAERPSIQECKARDHQGVFNAN